MTIAPCGRSDPHEHHVWTPEPRAINGPKRCPGVVARIPAGDVGRLEAYDYRAAFFRVLERCEELKIRVAEHQWNALEMARKADIAERRAEEAEFHVEQLRDARDSAERRIERTERLIDSWEHDGPDGYEFHLLIQRVREALDGGVA